jgi:hypothetical protein
MIIDAIEQTKNPEAAKGKSMPSCQAYQLNAYSSLECSVSITTLSIDRLESYLLIAVVVPAPLLMRGKVARATTRVAALTCKKWLWPSCDGDDH